MKNQGRVVTVARQMGSGGSYIGYQVAKALGFWYVDREIIHRAADLLNRDAVSLEEYEEKSTGIFQNLFSAFSLGAPETACYMPEERPVDDKDLFLLESKIIRDIADKHNAVIMGHGGFYILKDRPETVHLFISAPVDFRAERVMKADRTTDLRQARTKVEKSDQERTRFIRNMIGAEWTDARNYHLCIDSSIVGISESMRMVIEFVEKALR